jgi:hypothetical protein
VPEPQRQAACLEIASKIEANAEELARTLTAEQGKPLNVLGSRWEISGAIAWTRYTASLSRPMKVLQDNDEGRGELHRKPIGVVGSISRLMRLALAGKAPELGRGAVKMHPAAPPRNQTTENTAADDQFVQGELFSNGEYY